MQTDSLNFKEALSLAWKRMFEIKGRSRRSEYWWTILALCIFIMVVRLLLPDFLGSLLVLVAQLSALPLSVRRLHDTGRSGWWIGGAMIFGFIYTGLLISTLISSAAATGSINDALAAISFPLILGGVILLAYQITLLVFFCTDSHPTTNQYGKSPKYIEE